MEADYWPVVLTDELDDTSGSKNVALAIASQVVFVDRDVVLAILLLGLSLS